MHQTFFHFINKIKYRLILIIWMHKQQDELVTSIHFSTIIGNGAKVCIK
jgi:hypothetical protein